MIGSSSDPRVSDHLGIQERVGNEDVVGEDARIDGLRLGVFAPLRFDGAGFNAETQRRGAPEWICPERGCLARSPSRDRREPEREMLE
jgi:hypothetical protein